jgi:hypothetical protein
MTAPVPAWRTGARLGGVEILGLLADDGTVGTRTYQVRYLCCEARGEMLHETLMHRARKGIVLCHGCGQRQRFQNARLESPEEVSPWEQRRVPSAAELWRLWSQAQARVRRMGARG